MKITLDINKVQLLTRPGHTDRLYLDLANAKEILSLAVGPERAEEVFGHMLAFQVEVSKGCGEKLAAALGLKVDEVIQG